MKKTIQIKCKGSNLLPLDAILEFQGGLKKTTETNLNKLIKNILTLGFVAPIFVWDDKGDYKILDGHSRLQALIKLREQNYDIPLIPIVNIIASGEQEAKKILLSITSQYGDFQAMQLDEWLSEIDDDVKETLRFLNTELKFEKPDNKFDNKIPNVDIKGEIENKNFCLVIYFETENQYKEFLLKHKIKENSKTISIKDFENV